MIFDFDSILSKCRQIAAEVRKDPSELMLDFIDEIPDIPEVIVINVTDFDEDVETAAYIRDHKIIPTIQSDNMVILNFKGIKCATQSFVHACIYKIFRDVKGVANLISIAGATTATKEAIRAVVAYAVAESK